MKRIFFVALVLSLSGCGSEPPVSVELGQNQFWGTPQLRVTAITDEVTVEKIEVNRGNCEAKSQADLPRRLVMGNAFKVDALRCQSVVEVSVSTSAGQYDFTF